MCGISLRESVGGRETKGVDRSQTEIGRGEGRVAYLRINLEAFENIPYE